MLVKVIKAQYCQPTRITFLGDHKLFMTLTGINLLETLKCYMDTKRYSHHTLFQIFVSEVTPRNCNWYDKKYWFTCEQFLWEETLNNDDTSGGLYEICKCSYLHKCHYPLKCILDKNVWYAKNTLYHNLLKTFLTVSGSCSARWQWNILHYEPLFLSSKAES